MLVIGLGLLGFGLNATGAPMERLSETFTGRYSTNTTWYLIAGAAAVVAGGLLAGLGGRRR